MATAVTMGLLSSSDLPPEKTATAPCSRQEPPRLFFRNAQIRTNKKI
jgi:hypothetical protein